MKSTEIASMGQPLELWSSAIDYWVDAGQRTILFWDVLRQRGNQYFEHMAEVAPHVLNYDVELVLDGRTFDHPVNYLLARVLPPKGVEIDQTKRPFVVVDPRAGHGPGIGGFKSDSEIGVAFKAGHPCYFVGFLPEPMPGQTIEDIARAEAIFLEKVIALHPQADGKPCVIGNCQAGWAVMILASLRPELFGPIIVAGSPLSYWAGVRGKYPMRYSGGLLGGSWLTAMTSDLGGGTFDGAWLVQNFESQNPANTWWSKQYNLYSRIDTEAPRYLGFETWWGGHISLNAEEMQFIVDELFVGNNLAAGRIQTSDGLLVDLRNITAPILVLCSKGDNITPPQQALGWILDLYDSVDDIRSHGQTIVYSIHETVGHLGIFVSGSVAKKEHAEFSSNIDMIDVLPPGLYEAVIEAKTADTRNPDYVTGDWIMRCEARTLDDIRALGGNDEADERRFAAAARVSDIGLETYRKFAQPWVRAMASAPWASQLSSVHPLRLQFEMFSDKNPFMAAVRTAAEQVRQNRKPASGDNPYLALQEAGSRQLVRTIDAWHGLTESMAEGAFLSFYGSPALQAALGIDSQDASALRKSGRSVLHKRLLAERIDELKSRIESGGVREAQARAMLYVGMARGGGPDERTLAAIKRLRDVQDDKPKLTLAGFKKLLREQYFMLVIDRQRALDSIPGLLPTDPELRRKAFDVLCHVLKARGELEGEARDRLQAVAKLFGVPFDTAVPAENGGRKAKLAKAG